MLRLATTFAVLSLLSPAGALAGGDYYHEPYGYEDVLEDDAPDVVIIERKTKIYRSAPRVVKRVVVPEEIEVVAPLPRWHERRVIVCHELGPYC